RHDEAPGEGQVAVGGAAAPPRRGVAHGDPRHLAVDLEGKTARAATELLARLLLEEIAHPAGNMAILAGNADLAPLDPDRAAIALSGDVTDAVEHAQHRHLLAILEGQPRWQRSQPGF